MADHEQLPLDEVTPVGTPQSSWIGSVCAYFRDFLDTDFKKSRAPKRQISSRDRQGALTGIPASRYPEFNRDLLEALTTPFDTSMIIELKVRRGKYRSRLPKGLVAVIQKHIDSIDVHRTEEISDSVKARARSDLSRFRDDPEHYGDRILSHLKRELLLAVINPLIGKLDTVFDNEGVQSVETIFNLEEELGDRLLETATASIDHAVASAVVENSFEFVDTLVDDTTQLALIKDTLISFFENFATNDLHRELSELQSTLKLRDNYQTYAYFGALRFRSTGYPLFYVPIELSQSEVSITLRIEPHVLIAKKAMEFGVSEVSRSIGRHLAFSIDNRIRYIEENQSIIGSLQPVLDEFTSALTMDGSIDLRDPQSQSVRRTDVAIDNSLHVAAFDQSDEGLLNDFEELLEKLTDSDDQVGQDFRDLVMGFMTEEPVNLDDYVSEEWLSTSIPDRLVYDSPVPLNEEQRKILSAINAPEGKYVAVEGPPGTGKSHTITAVVFDSILKGRNVLILSDKKEALDVAEKKISDTLKAVRIDSGFQDPILRLGRSGSTYTKILATKTVDQMRQRLTVARAKEGRLEEEIKQKRKSLKDRIDQTQIAATGIDLQEIVGLQNEEQKVELYDGDIENHLMDVGFRHALLLAEHVTNYFSDSLVQQLLRIGGFDCARVSIEEFFKLQTVLCGEIDALAVTRCERRIGRFSVEQRPRLGDLIDEIDAARVPLFGYLFAGKKTRSIARKLSDEFEYSGADRVHNHLDELRTAYSTLGKKISALEHSGIVNPHAQNTVFVQLLSDKLPEKASLRAARDAFEELVGILDGESNPLAPIGLTSENVASLSASELSPVQQSILSIADHVRRYEKIHNAFSCIPDIDYAGEVYEFEKLQTQKLADTLDQRVVEFASNKRNRAAQIRTIIKKKQKFPKELFEDLRSAFPVMIAGIRDYAEYVPLERELFDLIIIDEASQVSIAQALPAFIRARKVLVLGDRNQFSNVKTENASIATNQAYRAQIIEQFKREEEPDDNLLNQIKVFDIKTSVLEFVERISSLRIMLRKHFRGYPELIGFSSKYFYEGALQAMKIRGKPIDDVIEFRSIAHDGLLEIQSNTNKLESNEIVERLCELAKLDDPPDVCVITPFTEQQRLIFREVYSLPDCQELVKKLRLRVFTFDTCQGEEADLCIYSMVATADRDRLGYIFAREIDAVQDVEENLRLQRLNVGFSRAKEKIEIYHSKPISEMAGGIQVALNHYQGVIRAGHASPDVGDVDAKSPMEARVLNWLRAVPVLQELSENVEIDAQFELGAYLRQLDPTYTHPNYKVDFLIKALGERGAAHIIVEYDGFKEHFTDLDVVDASNYREYMKPEDVERQKILEGYGYRFIRINRFNMGVDPVKTLDERLRRMLDRFEVQKATPSLIEEHKRLQQSISEGESKACSRCGKIKEVDDFYDKSLKGGSGAYGRVCLECKASDKKPRMRRRRRRRWWFSESLA